MTDGDLTALLGRLLGEPHETEWLEFKSDRHDPQQIGEYLSALANSACLLGKTRGYLVYGIENQTHRVVGTDFDPVADGEKGKGNQPLLLWLSLGFQPNVGFEQRTAQYQGKRVMFFEVHPAFDRPVNFYGTAYVRIGSSKTELKKYPEKERRIWQGRIDWSAAICEQATLSDLDPKAIEKARAEFKTKFKDRISDVDSWDDITFLNKAKVIKQGQITNAAILLLGKPESSTLLNPAVARISWILKDDKNQEQDYEHFEPPFILSVDKVLSKIRNLTLRHLPGGTLFPVEISQYEPLVLREALHNCIAHQDYGLRGRIQVIEKPDALVFTNVGSFLPESVESVIRQDAPLEIYRNPFLCEVMVNLNMIDTQGGGIKRMFQIQRKRFFPLPDYDLNEPERVIVTVKGQILDERYTRLLMTKMDLSLDQVMLLDRVQKKKLISRDEHQALKQVGLVEGRYPNLVVAAHVAATTGQKAQQIRDRGLDLKYYRDLIIQLIRKHGSATRSDIDGLLMDKLPEVLTPARKRNQIHNIIYSLSGRERKIKNIGSKRSPKWVLTGGNE